MAKFAFPDTGRFLGKYSCQKGVTTRCRLSWLTINAQMREDGVAVAGSQPMSTAVHMEPR